MRTEFTSNKAIIFTVRNSSITLEQTHLSHGYYRITSLTLTEKDDSFLKLLTQVFDSAFVHITCKPDVIGCDGIKQEFILNLFNIDYQQYRTLDTLIREPIRLGNKRYIFWKQSMLVFIYADNSLTVTEIDWDVEETLHTLFSTLTLIGQLRASDIFYHTPLVARMDTNPLFMVPLSLGYIRLPHNCDHEVTMYLKYW